MPEVGGGERPNSELSSQNASLIEHELSHDRLVKGFRKLIRQQQEVYSEIRSPNDREVLPPETIIRNQLDWYSDSPNKEQAESLFTLRSAWDALVYDRYEVGTREEGLAATTLEMYYSATHEPTIKLTDQRQVRLLEALTEAADIPHTKGQTEIEIPEKCRNRYKYLISEEYQEKLAQARAKSNK